MKLYLVRHGETEWNKVKKMQGRADLPINEIGLSQAQAVAEGLKEVEFDAVYSSPLQRAISTAKIIGRTDSLAVDDRLLELNFGLLEGFEYGHIKKEKATEYRGKEKKVVEFFGFPHKYIPLEGGETYNSLIKRSQEFLDTIANRHKDEKNILAVSHATSIHVLLSLIEDIPLERLWEIYIPNSSVTVVQLKEGLYKTLEVGTVFY